MLKLVSLKTKKLHICLGLTLCALLLLTLFVPEILQAQDIAQVKKGVVKITAQAAGKNKVGSGVIVKVDDDHVYLVTASHVIEGDSQPNVFFYTSPHRAYRARVLGLEGDDPAGLAALLVEGKVPSDLVALHLDQATKVSGGEPITLIGFPRAEGAMWTVTTGTLSGRKGTALSFSGTADEGNSGGPVLFQGSVVGIVTQVGAKFNSAVPAVVARFALEGWGVTVAAENPKSQSEEAKSGISGQTGSIDYSSFDQVKKAAERGDPKAMDVLGYMYSEGKVTRENFAEAAKWYRRSADAGYPEAFNEMGMLSLVKAMGFARDDESAVRFAQTKRDELNRLVASPQEYPVRNQVELKEAIRWLRRSAEEGQGLSAESQLALAQLFSAGVGVEKDPVQAAQWMRLAATKLPHAQALMGLNYLDGTGVKQDIAEGMRRLRDAADKDQPEACGILGFLYMEGAGVMQDFAEAAKLLRKAVDMDVSDPNPKGLLASLYFTGQGVSQDLHQAYRLAKESAEQGSAYGQVVLGTMLLSGRGVSQNSQEGVKWLQAAARKGNAHAQQMLREQGLNW